METTPSVSPETKSNKKLEEIIDHFNNSSHFSLTISQLKLKNNLFRCHSDNKINWNFYKITFTKLWRPSRHPKDLSNSGVKIKVHNVFFYTHTSIYSKLILSTGFKCFTISLTSLHSNLEHGLATLTESFSPF